MATPTTSSGVSPSDLSGEGIIDALIRGTQWSSPTISYSFPTYFSYWSTDSIYGYGSTNGSGEPWSWYYEPLSKGEATRFTAALQTWANVADIRFVKLPDNAASAGDIRVAYSADVDGQAWAYAPTSGAAYGGDIWINAWGTSYHGDYSDGSYTFLTLIHEIGHAIGLKHPFDKFANNGVTLENSGLGDLDSVVFTLMSYSGQAGDPTTWLSYQPTTPMLLDILAIQHLYGANTTYKTGNDVYRFSTDKTYLQTIYDAGGVDEISCTGKMSVQIDLRDGYGSSVGNTIYELDVDYQPIGTVSHNLWIAYGVGIENATGGGGNDTITGNASGNRLNGGAGADTLIGGDGNDTYVIDDAGDVVSEAAGEGIDLVQIAIAKTGSYTLTDPVENATLINTVAFTLTGNAGDNLLTGNAAANTLNGGEGNDTLDGQRGIDSLTGGVGNDTYVIDNAADVVSEADGVGSDGDDWIKASISVDLNLPRYAGIEHVELTGVLALTATGDADGNQLIGNAAANTLNGGEGHDTLNGGLGSDILAGGAGADIFRFDSKLNKTNVDTLMDFMSSDGDKIELENATFTGLMTLGDFSASSFCSGNSSVAAIKASDENDYLLYDNHTGNLYYDADGSGSGLAVRFAMIFGHPPVSATDFFVT